MALSLSHLYPRPGVVLDCIYVLFLTLVRHQLTNESVMSGSSLSMMLDPRHAMKEGIIALNGELVYCLVCSLQSCGHLIGKC